ncbi:TPA: hypothetical protein N0F65_007455 [Lagenidium giganteum]|uniref:Heat shock protein 70 n=1 Tax=Lagenidium giganteum TaxID=4803 RepID=A0AAV2ZCU4_9STRA|nr:TPA: hypothetical protein N0F65_007455 [Lagenidium giganteum]
MLVGGVGAVVAALLARSGFRGRQHVVGVDLGTTYSVVGIAQGDNVTIVPDQYGHLIIPSMVAFLDDGDVLVGRQARAHRTKDPAHTVFNAKRFIGRSLGTVKEAVDLSPYEFSVSSADGHESSDACFRVQLPGHSPCVTPIQVGAHIVRQLHAMATTFVGHNQITSVVIAVPVDFDHQQRKATAEAFKTAGLKVVRVLEEPTAAAIAYGLHQDPSVSFIMVFDFGGGTLDVSLLFSRSGSISVVDTLGDNNLGGEDVDAVLTTHLAQHVEKKLGVKLVSSSSEIAERDSERVEDPTELPCTLAGLRRAAELLKRQLSSHLQASTTCIPQSGKNGQRSADAITLSFTREEFETLCAPLLQRTLIPVQEILSANHMTAEDVDEVVLVGGSSRIPWIRTKLTELFNGKPPRSDIDPDVAVAYGAARALD